MRVLFVDAHHSIDQATLQAFHTRGHDLTAVGSAGEVLDLAGRNEFDCIFLDISTAGDCFGLAELRLLAKSSGMALMTTSTVEALTAEALAQGNLELRPVPVLISNIQELTQPALLVAPDFHPALIKIFKDNDLRVSIASTLQFAMNLLVDGWCQIVCLKAAIPGWTQPDTMAIAHHITAREIAIFASGLPDTGIILTKKPRKTGEFIALLEHLGGSRALPCGLVETRYGHKNP